MTEPTLKPLQLPVGISDFGALIDKKLNFVDKSLFIQEILQDANTQVAVIIRPRRFGKTLNMSMLYHFLASEVLGRSTQGLFDNLKIAQWDEFKQHQGKYPTLFMTFKDIKQASFASAYEKLNELIVSLYDEHSYLLKSDKLTKVQKNFFKTILSREASQSQIENAPKFLTQCLYLHHGIKPWILIDEYDTPIQASYLNGYYDEMVSLMRSLFGTVLKDNPFLDKGVVTGILRVARESLFSDLNNLKVYSVLNEQYGQYFGFTESEVSSVLKQAGLEGKAAEIKTWYNGYQIGSNTLVYNPWSIANCVDTKGTVEPYWINTSDNQLIKNLLLKAPLEFKEQFEILLRGETTKQIVDEHTAYGDLGTNYRSAWSLLLMSGYLTIDHCENTDRGKECTLRIPNREVRNLYRKIIEQWLANGYGLQWYDELINGLIEGKLEIFKDHLNRILLETASSHDFANAPEIFYQGLMIGLTASLYGRYETKSNRESGYGRYDFVIMPKDLSKLAIVMEFKRVAVPEKSAADFTEKLPDILRQEASNALKQIDEKKYISELKQRGFKDILKIGLAYCGKYFVLQEGQEK